MATWAHSGHSGAHLEMGEWFQPGKRFRTPDDLCGVGFPGETKLYTFDLLIFANKLGIVPESEAPVPHIVEPPNNQIELFIDSLIDLLV